MTTRKASRLRKGDLIGIVSPASPIADPMKIEAGVRYLESLGYRATVGEHATKAVGYLAGSDKERVEDLHAMLSDKKVRAILCVRGGYGTPRLLSLLDFRLISANPKIIVGFSDITAIQLAIWKKCRLVTFHGPMLGVDMAGGMDSYAEEMFWRLITSTRKPERIEFNHNEAEPLHGGRSMGCLLGGNLSLLVSLLGTRFLPDFRDAVLFLEEVGEEPYRIDRMLTQLSNARLLDRVKAILGGSFSDCVPKDPKAPSRTTDDVLVEVAAALRIPFLTKIPFGHVTRKLTLPVGVRARVDADARSIQLIEAAVK